MRRFSRRFRCCLFIVLLFAGMCGMNGGKTKLIITEVVFNKFLALVSHYSSIIIHHL